MEQYLAVLGQNELFRGIKSEKLLVMLQCLGMNKKSYAKDQQIVRVGDAVTEVGILLSGSVQIIHEDILGNRTIVEQLTVGHVFAETLVCTSEQSSPVMVIATAVSDIIFVQFKRIITTCSSACEFHTKLIENMLQIVAKKNRQMNQKLHLLSQRNMRDKLKQYFLYHIEATGKREFSIPFTRNQLADYLCVDRSALSRELGHLRNRGIINFNKNHFEIREMS